MKQALRVGASSGKLPDPPADWAARLLRPIICAGYALKITPEMQKEYGVTQNVTPASLRTSRLRRR